MPTTLPANRQSGWHLRMLRLLYSEAPGVVHAAIRQTFHNSVLFTTMYDLVCGQSVLLWMDTTRYDDVRVDKEQDPGGILC